MDDQHLTLRNHRLVTPARAASIAGRPEELLWILAVERVLEVVYVAGAAFFRSDQVERLGEALDCFETENDLDPETEDDQVPQSWSHRVRALLAAGARIDRAMEASALELVLSRRRGGAR